MKNTSFFIAFALLLIVSSCSYNTSLALQLAHLSDIAYDSASTINAWNCAYCKIHPINSVKVFSNTTGNIQGYSGFSPSLNLIVISFRGSTDIKNWIINLSSTQSGYSKCSGCAVHTGFL
jgi:hypothetical protein